MYTAECIRFSVYQTIIQGLINLSNQYHAVQTDIVSSPVPAWTTSILLSDISGKGPIDNKPSQIDVDMLELLGDLLE